MAGEHLRRKQKDIFKKLSIFRGGFQQEAAIQIANATINDLLTLLDKLLLYCNETTYHYYIHESLRPYAIKKLAQIKGEQEKIEEKYALYFSTLFHQQLPNLKGVDSETISTFLGLWLFKVAHNITNNYNQ